MAVTAAGTAQAAKRRVPAGFFGAVLDPAETDPVSNPVLDAQMALMARSGVESVRIPFAWNVIESRRGKYDWTSPDRLVLVAARHGISVLPNVDYTPRWASDHPADRYFFRYQPRSPQFFAEFATEMVRRYGPSGSVWRLHPGTRRVPVREWQVWNEEAFNVFWASLPWGRNYTKLLKAGYLAIHHADRGASVVAGSFAAVGSYTNWSQVADLYRAGAKRYFDVISVHPFTIDQKSVSNTVTRVLTIVGRVRAVMLRNRDGAKPIIITELAWPAAIGSVAPARLLGLETTPRGETLRLAAAYRYLGTHVHQTGVTQVYWFTWASNFNRNDPQSDVGFRFSGLNRFANGVFYAQPVLQTYARVAASLEGR